MRVARPGIASAVVAAVLVVVIVVAGATAYYAGAQGSTKTVTSFATSTATAPAVTSTETTTAPPSTVTSTASASTITSTATVITTQLPIIITSTAPGRTTTVTSLASSTATVSSTTTITSTKTTILTASSQSSSASSGNSSSTTSSTTSSTSTSCTTSATTAAVNATTILPVVVLLKSFSKMSVTLGTNTSQGPELINYSYAVVYASPSVSSTTYKVDFAYAFEGFSVGLTAWVLSNGTVLATESGLQNTTGSSAYLNLLENAAPFIIAGEYTQSITPVPASEFHSVGQENVRIGSVNMTVTIYEANSLPLVFSDCNGDVYSLNTFVLEVGTVPGTNVTLLTYLDQQGTVQSSGESQPTSLLLRVTSITFY